MPSRTNEPKPDQIAGDRREDRRYPMALELKYQLIRRRRVLEVGRGYTVDLSSGGILFEAEHPLPVGLNVELLIDWPVLLHNVAPMRLLVTGKIVRNFGSRVAIQTVQHEFRTQGAIPSQDPAGRPMLERRPISPMQFFNPSRAKFGNVR
jgi:hypothetical protein